LLDGRVVLLTGAVGGIGRRLAIGLAEAGAHCALHYRSRPGDAEELAERVRALGREVVLLQGDLADSAQARAVVDGAVAHFGRCDVLVNNAGAAWRKPFLEVTPDLWRQTFAANVESAFHCTSAVAPHMIRAGGGKVVNVGSIVADLATATLVPYCCAKAAVHMFTKAAAVALAPYKITVNAIAPGVVLTERMQLRMWNPRNRERVLARTPTGTLVRPEDLVGVVIFLASALSDHLTGQIFVVDHGYSLQGLEWEPE
jgi:NAD(P)-dependent dehydrogenase (short-subunit alcohol dehydrogenase family)